MREQRVLKERERDANGETHTRRGRERKSEKEKKKRKRRERKRERERENRLSHLKEYLKSTGFSLPHFHSLCYSFSCLKVN